nr:hypothetical protein [Tanacetum cinerariifolium]
QPLVDVSANYCRKKRCARNGNSFEDDMRHTNIGFRTVLPASETTIYLGGRNRSALDVLFWLRDCRLKILIIIRVTH